MADEGDPPLPPVDDAADSDLSDLEEQEVVADDLADDVPSDVEYEGEDLEGAGSSRRPRKRPVKPRDGGAASIPTGLDDAARAKVLEVRADFDKAMRAMTNSRKRRKDTDLQEAEHLAASLRDRMRDAAEADAQNHRQRLPGLRKLRMLPEVERTLARTDLHEHLLDHHILEGFLAWLEPLHDGSLPLYDIRLKLFELLLALPVATDHLRECRIGPLVLYYSKCQRETKEIRRMAQECITKWSRPILGLSDSYRDMRLEERRVDLREVRARPVLAPQGGALEDGAQQPAKRARVPIPNASGYSVRPMSNVADPGSGGAGKRDARAIDRTLQRLKQAKSTRR